MTDYQVAMEGIIGTSTVITNLKSILYSFRIYAFNEYFKGEIGPIVDVDLDLAPSQSLSSVAFIGDINAEVIIYLKLLSYSCLSFTYLFVF